MMYNNCLCRHGFEASRTVQIENIKLEACYEKTDKGSTNGFATDFARTKAPHTISLEVSKRFSSFLAAET